MAFFAVVLAAGQGTRMKSSLHKVLHPLCGKPMLHHVLDHLQDSGAERIVTVVGKLAEQVKTSLEESGYTSEFAYQQEQLGTAHAVMQTAPILEGREGVSVICYGDGPLISAESVRNLVLHHRDKKAAVTVLTAMVDNPFGYGRIIRDQDGKVLSIVEEKDASPEQKKIREINSGTYVFDNRLMFEALKQIDNNNAQAEYLLPDLLHILRNQGHLVATYITQDSSEILGVNDRIQLAQVEKILQDRIRHHHMKNGVTLIHPDSIYIETDVQIAPDTVIYPGTHLRKGTVIGHECLIGPNAEIEQCQIGDRVTIRQSVLLSSFVGSDVTVGPFAYIRPGSDIGSGAKIGDFVEIKNSSIGEGTKIPHLSYVGDAEVGAKTNIGCGTITVNYDGVQKHKTIIGNGVFVGCNSNLVAPVSIGDGSYVAAGSTITESVPEESLAIARQRQTIKVGRAQLLRSRLHANKKAAAMIETISEGKAAD